jgi:4-amino-4-deoxy-L-arabinose transferase-like glycosyltransferase
MRKYIQTYYPAGVLLLSIVLIIGFAVRFAMRDSTPMYWDFAYHVSTALSYYSAFSRHDFSYVLTYNSHYPPFVYWFYMPYMVLLGPGISAVVVYNMTLVFMLLYAVYLLLKKEHTSVFAITGTLFALGLLYAIVHPYALYKPLYDFMLDVPLVVTTFIAYSFVLYGLRKSIYSPKYASAIGAVCGIAILTKWTGAFVVPACVVSHYTVEAEQIPVAGHTPHSRNPIRRMVVYGARKIPDGGVEFFYNRVTRCHPA